MRRRLVAGLAFITVLVLVNRQRPPKTCQRPHADYGSGLADVYSARPDALKDFEFPPFSQRMIRKKDSYYDSSKLLRTVRAAMGANAPPLFVTVLGGSVTFGRSDVSDELLTPWPQRLGRYLKAVLKINALVVNRAVAGTTSEAVLNDFSFAQELLNNKPHLVIVDYSLNDDSGKLESSDASGVLSLMALLSTLDPQISVLYVESVIKPGFCSPKTDFFHYELLNKHAVPAAWWTDFVCPQYLNALWPTVHPSEQVHELFALMIATWLGDELSTCDAAGGVGADFPVFARRNAQCALRSTSINPSSASGYVLTGGDKPGWVSNSADACVEYVLPNGLSRFSVAYLKSYERVGDVDCVLRGEIVATLKGSWRRPDRNKVSLQSSVSFSSSEGGVLKCCSKSHLQTKIISVSAC